MERTMEINSIERIHKCFSRALPTYNQNAKAQREICQHLISLLPKEKHFERILEIGCGTGSFTHLLKQHCITKEWVLNDLCEGCEEWIAKYFPNPNAYSFYAGNAEFIDFPGKYDLIASASVFQWMKEPNIFLQRLSKKISSEGVLLFSSFLPDNLQEVTSITQKGLQYPCISELYQWLTPLFNLVYIKEDEIILTFKTPIDVLKHLKSTGVTATGNGVWTRGMLNKFSNEYKEKFSTTNNNVKLTYHPVYVLAIKK